MLTSDPYAFITSRLSSKRTTANEFATFFCVMLDEAEHLFGPKLNPYPFMFAGINFDSTPHIEIWGDYIMIRLSRTSFRNRPQALWELSHECIHLLSPDQLIRSTVLEEGIASWYQRRWVEKSPSVFPDWSKEANYGISASQNCYNEAADLVHQLCSVDETIIKRLRLTEPCIRKITALLIRKEAPWIERSIANQLVRTFPIS